MESSSETRTTVIEQLTDAWNAHDREAMAELYAADLTIPNAESGTHSREKELDALSWPPEAGEGNW